MGSEARSCWDARCLAWHHCLRQGPAVVSTGRAVVSANSFASAAGCSSSHPGSGNGICCPSSGLVSPSRLDFHPCSCFYRASPRSGGVSQLGVASPGSKTGPCSCSDSVSGCSSTKRLVGPSRRRRFPSRRPPFAAPSSSHRTPSTSRSTSPRRRCLPARLARSFRPSGRCPPASPYQGACLSHISCRRRPAAS